MPTGRLFERPVAGWGLPAALCAGGTALLWFTIDQWFFGWAPERTHGCVWAVNGGEAGPATVRSQRNAGEAGPTTVQSQQRRVMCLGVGSAFVVGAMITGARWLIARRRRSDARRIAGSVPRSALPPGN